MFDIDVENSAKWGKRLAELGLASSAVTVRGPDEESDQCRSGHSPKEASRPTSSPWIAAQRTGCEAMVGPYHSALGEFSGKGPTDDDEWKWGVREHARSGRARREGGCHVGPGIPQPVRVLFPQHGGRRAPDSSATSTTPACKMMYDTFHAHIEEKNIPDAIRALKDCLGHVHISEKRPQHSRARCNVRWKENFDTLAEIGYDGLMVIESFRCWPWRSWSPATKIWRRMYQSERQLAVDGLAFMKGEVAKRA